MVFVSYSHRDMAPIDWLERLRLYLAPFRRNNGVETWDDSKIQYGSDWRSEIGNAIDRAAAAILLVGPGFLASEFITTDELPRILRSARNNGLSIYPVIVAYSSYRRMSLGDFQSFNDPDKPLESLSLAEQNKSLNELSLAVDERVRNLQAVPGTSGDEDVDPSRVLIEIQRNVSNTFKAFNAQAAQRNDLVRRMSERLTIHERLQYEKFFFRYFQEMNAEERFEFRRIRALTEGPLYQGNTAVLKLLSRFPRLVDRFPELADLQQHLVFWINKYERVFAQTPEMAVLYTGVEDAVPFPSGLDEKLRKWIEGAGKRDQ